MGYWYKGTWYDGDNLCLKTDDPSFLFGATLFTTARIHHSSLDHPLGLWSDHGDRLRHSIQTLRWAAPNWDDIRRGAEKMASVAPVIRITLLHDGRELILGRSLPEQLKEKQQQGIKGWIAPALDYQRPQASFKTGNYLSAWQARQRALNQGAGEAILLNMHGQWLETATGNLWGFRQGTWYTPPLGEILPGVMRLYLQRQLTQCQIPFQEIPWDLELVQTFEAIAYSNSVVGVIPFQEILGGAIEPWPLSINHPAVRQLQHLSGQLMP
ncbi:aminotransferase class IV [Picosynechococcus sp. NKBG15041c]|uniref:aminotransferase class IV n=1 Tax=Picosynechococcus sp. NKBG15041c TaxID=1407650 RepID=UPI000418DEED|nr:aminotransferase class IV [Picosynechococcus sp. NKBG15041c]